MTAIEAISTAAALLYCREVTRRRARNFYYGLKLLPEPQRSALYAIYAWMRRADDLVDAAGEGGKTAETKLVDFGRKTVDAVGGAAAGTTSARTAMRDPVLVGLHEVARRFPLDVELFRAMLEGQLDDLAGRSYRTFADLREYCERVASSVGLVCISIWGYEGEEAPTLAVERGIAFQLTNILRDVNQDLDSGRVYLPREDFERHGITPETLRAWADPVRCRSFLLEQIDRAEDFYRRSEPLDDMITPACRPTLWTMTRIYHGLLRQMRADPARIIRGRRVRLGALNKGTIVIRARLRARSARSAGSAAR